MKKRTLLLFTLMMMMTLAGCIKDAPKEIGFEIDTTNAVLTFAYNEDFSSQGLVIRAVLDNDNKTVLTSGFTVDQSGFHKGIAGEYIIKVNYKEFTPKSYQVTVTPAPEVGFVIDTTNVKKEFVFNSSFNSDNLVVKAKFEDDSLVNVTEFTVDSSAFKAGELGAYLISVKYKDYPTQTYEVTVVTDIVDLVLDTGDVQFNFGKNQDFNYSGLVVKVKKVNDELVEIEGFEVDSTAFVKGTPGTYQIKVSYLGFEKSYQVSIKNEVYLSTPEDIVSMIASGIKVGEEYLLLNDIDMQGVALTHSESTISGTLNGQGFTIKNIASTATLNKRGVFFQFIDATAIIENINFVDSTFNSGGEAGAFLGRVARGGAIFRHLTFTEVAVVNSGPIDASYIGLLFGDTEAASELPITVSHIIVNNQEAIITTGKYAGGLIGRINHAITVNLSYIYFNGTVKSMVDESCSAMIGRVAAGTINFDNVVIEGLLDGKKNVGALVGTASAGTLNVTNVLVTNLEGKSTTSAIDSFVGNNKFTTSNIQAYYISDQVTLYNGTNIKTPTQGTAVLSTEMTSAWFETCGIDTTYWMLEATRVLLNDKQVKTEIGFALDTSKVKLSFAYDEDFNFDKLVIKSIFDNDSFVYVTNFSIDASQFVKGVPGTYLITVSYKEYGTKTYEVVVLPPQATHITIDTTLAKVEFELGTAFNPDGLVVKVHYEDNSVLEVTSFTVDPSLYDANLPGYYQIIVNYGNLTTSYEVEVYSLEVIGFELDITNVKSLFERGEAFSFTGLIVKEKYLNGRFAPTLEYTVDSNLYEALIPGDYEISVSYGEYEVIKYTVTVMPADIKELYIVTTDMKLTYARNQSFSPTGLVVKATNLNDEQIVLESYHLNSSAFTKGVVGRYFITISYQGFEQSFEVEIIDEFHLVTPEDIVSMIASGIKVGEEYLLLNDIDMQGVALTHSESTISGTLNGQGFTIKNITSTATVNKRGVFFHYIDSTAIIENINFVDSTFNSGGEAGAFLGRVARGGAIFRHLTFTEVVVVNSGPIDASYIGLLFGDTEAASELPITVSHITVNNQEAIITTGKYAGGLIGRINHAITVNLSYIYFNGTVKSIVDESCSAMIGRVAAGTINFDNVVIEGLLDGKKNVGALVGTASTGTLNVTNVVVTNLEGKSTTSAIETLVGNNKFTTSNIQKTYHISDQVTLYNGVNVKTPTQSIAVLSTDMPTWFETCGLNTTYWQLVGTKITKA